MPRFTSLAIALFLISAVASACSDESAQPIRSYATPMRSDDELTAELRHLCKTSIAGDHQAVLVEFSAAWCSDCRRLGEMKQAKALAAELAEWPNLTVNVGRFDHHRPILDAMQIQSIAHWAILRPANCQDPIDQWARIADRTLEVSSGEARKLTPADLARWLRQFRRS